MNTENETSNLPISHFDFDQMNTIRVINIDNSPWFVATDICAALEHTNPSVAIQGLDDDERSKHCLGRQGDALIVNESGLYSLIFLSRKENAKKFKKWVTSEVLPAIRKTGQYQTATVASRIASKTPQQTFRENHKAACLLFSDKQTRLSYANRVTFEQIGFDVLADAGVALTIQNSAMQNLLDHVVDGRTIKSLLDSVHYGHLDCGDARNALKNLSICLKNGWVTIGNPCPLVGFDDRKSLQAINGARVNISVHINNRTVRGTSIELY